MDLLHQNILSTANNSLNHRKIKMEEIERANQFKVGDHMMAKNVAEMLEKKYPGWLWAVSVDRGLVTVKSMMLSGNWGFVLHENKIDNDLKSVVKAGGEILERYNQHRGKFNQTKYSDLTMDHKNQLSGDRS
jgi:predicted enzyme related to lactoylglutathione lyase